MHMAHLIYGNLQQLASFSSVQLDWSDSVKEAWAIQRVREAMQSGVVRLYFTKNNGEHAARVGTLCADYIPGSKMPKGIRDAEIEQGLAEPVWNVINYYDLTRHDWRSLDVRNLQKAESVMLVSELRYIETNVRLY